MQPYCAAIMLKSFGMDNVESIGYLCGCILVGMKHIIYVTNSGSACSGSPKITIHLVCFFIT